MNKEDIDYIKNILRKGTTSWSGRAECLNRGRRKKKVGVYKNGKDKFLWERECDSCKKWFFIKDSLLEVDHIKEVGPFEGSWDDYVRRLYCGQENLQALCTPCHLKKTNIGNAALRFSRKNNS